MAHDALRNTGLTRAVTDLLADLSDLVQKELRLAKAEVAENISARLQAGVWMVAAAALAFIAILLLVEAAVFAIASYYGLALHWSCLVVALVLAAAGAIAFSRGRSLSDRELAPTRTIKQVSRDIQTAKEQLT